MQISKAILTNRDHCLLIAVKQPHIQFCVLMHQHRAIATVRAGDQAQTAAAFAFRKILFFVAGVDALDADSIIGHVRRRLAAYKAPKDVVRVDSIGRAPSGKVDYAALRALARERLGR